MFGRATIRLGIGPHSSLNFVLGSNPNEHRMEIEKELECGPMPNVMAALPNIGGALCSTRQSLADAHY